MSLLKTPSIFIFFLRHGLSLVETSLFKKTGWPEVPGIYLFIIYWDYKLMPPHSAFHMDFLGCNICRKLCRSSLAHNDIAQFPHEPGPDPLTLMGPPLLQFHHHKQSCSNSQVYIFLSETGDLISFVTQASKLFTLLLKLVFC